MADQLHQFCISHDGLSKDIFTIPTKFYKCPACSCIFSKDKLPCLLECGHLISNDQCLQYYKECPIPTCKKPLNIKKYNYDGLFRELKPKVEITYMFEITVTGSSTRGKIIFGITRQNTIASIIERQIFAKIYLQGIRKQAQLIVLNGKTLRYMEVKDKKLKELSNINLVDQSTRYANKINIYNRDKGGKKQDDHFV